MDIIKKLAIFSIQNKFLLLYRCFYYPSTNTVSIRVTIGTKNYRCHFEAKKS